MFVAEKGLLLLVISLTAYWKENIRAIYIRVPIDSKVVVMRMISIYMCNKIAAASHCSLL